MFFVIWAYICAVFRLEVGSFRPRDSGGPAGAFVQQTSGIDGNVEGKNMKLSAITVMTALSAMTLSGCGDSAVKNFKDLHPGISFESASKFLDKYAKENKCDRNPSENAYWLTCRNTANLDIKSVSSQNVFDFITYILADRKSHVVLSVERSAQLTNKTEMDRAFEEVLSNARKQHGDDGWREETTEPQSINLGGKMVTIGAKTISMKKKISGKTKKSISKAIIYSPKGNFTFMVLSLEENS